MFTLTDGFGAGRKIRSMVSFDDIVDMCKQPEVKEKDKAFTYVPAIFKDGTEVPNNKGVLYKTGIALDYDKVDEACYTEIETFLKTKKPKALVYTTYRSTEVSLRLRLLLPFSRNFTPAEFEILKNKIINILPGKVDTSCFILSQSATVPCKGSKASHFDFMVNEGECIDQLVKLDTMTTKAIEPSGIVTYVPKKERKETAFSLKWIDKIIKEGSQSPEGSGPWLFANMLAQIKENRLSISAGERHDTIRGIVQTFINKRPYTLTESLVLFFQHTLDACRFDINEFISIVESAKTKKQNELAEKLQKDLELTAKRIGADSVEPYTEQDLSIMFDKSDLSENLFEKSWILKHDSFLYTRICDTYTQDPIKIAQDPAVVKTEIERDLLPLILGGFLNTKVIKGEDVVEKTFPVYFRDIGTTIKDVVYRSEAYGETKQYNPDNGGVLCFNTWKTNKLIKPKYHEAVDTYFRTVTGAQERDTKDYINLLMWGYALFHTDQPCALLHIYGPAGTGKTQTMRAFSKVFASAPTNISNIIGQYQYELLDTCFVCADEGLPDLFKSHPKENLRRLREMISKESWDIQRKFKAPVKAKGHIRILSTGNDEYLLPLTKDLTQDEQQATAERTYTLEFKDEGRRHLTGLSDRQFYDLFNVQMPEHLVWLRDNAESIPEISKRLGNKNDNRFFLDRDERSINRQIIDQDHLLSRMINKIITLIWRKIADPVSVEDIWFKDGEVYVCTGRVFSNSFLEDRETVSILKRKIGQLFFNSRDPVKRRAFKDGQAYRPLKTSYILDVFEEIDIDSIGEAIPPTRIEFEDALLEHLLKDKEEQEAGGN